MTPIRPHLRNEYLTTLMYVDEGDRICSAYLDDSDIFTIHEVAHGEDEATGEPMVRLRASMPPAVIVPQWSSPIPADTPTYIVSSESRLDELYRDAVTPEEAAE